MNFTLHIPRIDIHIHQPADPAVLHAIADLRNFIMVSNTELVTQLNEVKAELEATTAQNTKASGEVVAAVAALTQRIADLEAVIAAGGSDVPPEVIEAFNGVKAAADAAKASAQALDDLNPDAP